MRLIARWKSRLYRWLGVVSPSDAVLNAWAEAVVSGPMAPERLHPAVCRVCTADLHLGSTWVRKAPYTGAERREGGGSSC